jgi:hypothetical protein
LRTAALLAVLSFAGPIAAQQVYFGNLHSHTSYSDGSGKPAEACQYARNTAKVDFLMISEHNHIQAEDGARRRECESTAALLDDGDGEGDPVSELVAAGGGYDD